MTKSHLFDQVIDRTSPEPFYLQLSDAVEKAIENGEFGPGDKIPSETELCRSFDLARSTVRETLRTLVDRNRVRVVPRRGAFVVEEKRKGWILQVAEGFFEGEVNHDRRHVETTLISAGLENLHHEEAQALDVQIGSQGYVIKRLRKLDGQTALYSENYLLPELKSVVEKSAVLKSEGSLNVAMSEGGYQIFGARRTVESVAAEQKISEQLEIPVGTPVLLIKSISWDKNERPFDFYRTWARSDVVPVTIQASISQQIK